MSEHRRLLVKFTHGIGDATQFTVVLKHLRKYRPDWLVDVVSGRGKHSAFRGLCHATYFDEQLRPADDAYHEAKWVAWYENYNGYTDRPNSKITNCLAEEFGIEYDPVLGRDEIRYSPAERARAREYLAGIGATPRGDGRFNVVGLHYEGNTSTDKKNLGHHHARAVCEAVTSCGGKVLLFDWDRRSPLPDGKGVINPGVGPGDLWGNFGSGDAAMIAALIDQCAGFVGIDSGPGKIATATETPTVIVWTGHHPLQFHDPAPGTLHLVPEGHETAPPITADPQRIAYFGANYRHETYPHGGLGLALCQHVARFLVREAASEGPGENGLVRHGPFWVRSDNFDQDLVIVQDVYYGDCYRTALYDLGSWKTVVDVGGHIGTFTKLVHQKNPNAKIAVVEACPENHAALRANVGRFATVVAGAMTYEPGELALLNAVRPNCESTGGSIVVRRADLVDPNHPLRQHGYQYWDDLRPLRKVTLGDVMREAGMTHVDCLKLDCEGAEYSILENAPEMTRVRFVFGEYHDRPRWDALRARLFPDWPYGQMHEDRGRGVFHMVNPRFDPNATIPASSVDRPAPKSEPDTPLVPLRPGDDDYAMHVRLAAIVFDAVGHIDRPRIVETGIRQGHSGLVYFDVCPNAEVIGYDSFTAFESGPADEVAARANLAGKNYRFDRTDTNTLVAFPPCDFVFVDGDHSFGGCYGDLVRAANTGAPVIVVDDYHPDMPSHPVTGAVNWWTLHAPKHWTLTTVPVNDHTPPHHLAVLSRLVAEPKSFGAPWGGVLKVATVAGIGDTAWVATKLPAIVERLGATGVDVYTCDSDRAHAYLAKLPFVRRTLRAPANVVPSEVVPLPSGAYNYSPSQPGWHGEYHLLLQANGHLETGAPLSNWLPTLETDYAAPVAFADTVDDAAFADAFASRGPYVTFFAGPFDGNTVAGHNRGGVWAPDDWSHVCKRLVAAGVRVALVGSGPGDRDYAVKALYPARFFDHGAEDYVNLWDLPRTLAVLRRAAGHVGYQSGLGILSVYFGIPTAMFWNRYGYPLNDHGATFREEMACAWVPPTNPPLVPGVPGANYFPAIYGRTDAAAVADFIVDRVATRAAQQSSRHSE